MPRGSGPSARGRRSLVGLLGLATAVAGLATGSRRRVGGRPSLAAGGGPAVRSMHVCNCPALLPSGPCLLPLRTSRREVSPPILVPVDTTQILLLALPVVIIELALIIFALRDLLQPERRVRGDSKLMWGIIVV